MASKTFKQALKESVEKKPEWGTYVHMCCVLSESGTSRTEINKFFNESMSPSDYDKAEKKELIDYLVKISKVPKK